MDADQLNETIHKIYAAAADFGLWSEALHSIEELTASAGAVMNFVPRRDSGPLTIAGRFGIAECTEYSLKYQSICPRIAFAIQRPELPVHYDSMVLTESEMDRDPVYDWFGKHGLRYYVGGHLSGTANHQVYFSLQRTRSQGHVERKEIQLFRQLQSHLSQAVTLAERMGTLGTHWRLTVSLLDTLPHAVFLLNDKAEMLFANAAGDKILADGDALRLFDRQLVPLRTPEQSTFNKLVSGTSADGQWMRLSRASGRVPYALFVSKLAVQDSSPFGARPTTAVVLHDLTAKVAFDVTELKQLYGLSDAEGRVATALAGGHDVASAAAALGVSTGTIRSQLKPIFLKMQINRQQDLVRILATLGGRF